MMTRPRRIRIAPHWYSVRPVKSLSQAAGILGACGSDDTEIIYDPAQAGSILRETLLHEALHAVFSQTELDRVYSDEEEERIVWSLAPRLLSLLRDNPRFVEWLKEEEA